MNENVDWLSTAISIIPDCLSSLSTNAIYKDSSFDLAELGDFLS